MVYMGLSGNRISDYSIGEYLPDSSRFNFEILDLSFNKLSNLTRVLSRLNYTNRLNLEKNLIDSVRMIAAADGTKLSVTEINLRSNFIQNTSLENFRQEMTVNSKPIGLRLAGNPLVCDCNSIWLLEMVEKLRQTIGFQPQTSRGAQILNRKKPKSNEMTMSNKLHREKRDMEVISYHNIDQDPNFSTFMQRQKRLNSTIGGLKAPNGVLKLLDLEQLTCNFIDVQDLSAAGAKMSGIKTLNQQHHQQQHLLMNIDRIAQGSGDYDMSTSYDYYMLDSVAGREIWKIF